MKLQDKVAIVTGAGQGIGKGIARVFAREGARVVIATVEDEGKLVEDELRNAGGEAVFIQTDVASLSSIQAMVTATLERYGQIDVLVNNAGITAQPPLLEATLEDWERIVNVNLRGTFFCSKYAALEMVRRGRGSIINISSNHAHATLPNFEIYAATKGGINAMTRAMALSLGPQGVRVNAICPGFTLNDRFARWINAGENAEQKANLNALHATGRMSEPEDMAHLALYLAADESFMMTGENLTIDGGLSIRLFHGGAWRKKAGDSG